MSTLIFLALLLDETLYGTVVEEIEVAGLLCWEAPAAAMILGESALDDPEDMEAIGLLYSMECISELNTVSFSILCPGAVVPPGGPAMLVPGGRGVTAEF